MGLAAITNVLLGCGCTCAEGAGRVVIVLVRVELLPANREVGWASRTIGTVRGQKARASSHERRFTRSTKPDLAPATGGESYVGPAGWAVSGGTIDWRLLQPLSRERHLGSAGHVHALVRSSLSLRSRRRPANHFSKQSIFNLPHAVRLLLPYTTPSKPLQTASPPIFLSKRCSKHVYCLQINNPYFKSIDYTTV